LQKNMQRMDKLQYLLCADDSQSLLIVLQALDAGGKDGTVRHVFSGMNPQGTRAFDFKQPSKEELAHDFLWRAHMHTPAKGQDVLVVRVHDLVPQSVWSKRYDLISDFEKMLSANGTHVLKFYLHISPEGQLARFAQRLDDPARNWKFSESDYSERALWPQYVQAYEDAIALTTTKRAPWYVIPANHKWFRDLAISQIIADTMDETAALAGRPRGHPPQVSCRGARGEDRRQARGQSDQDDRVAEFEFLLIFTGLSDLRTAARSGRRAYARGDRDPGAARLADPFCASASLPSRTEAVLTATAPFGRASPRALLPASVPQLSSTGALTRRSRASPFSAACYPPFGG
jgi:PPK2 family polyphosphate:nucleotide phosphotransferase